MTGNKQRAVLIMRNTVWFLLALILFNTELLASIYVLPPQDVDVIGARHLVQVAPGETLLDLARRTDTGQQEIILANPDISRWTPPVGIDVQIPAQIVLPDVEREGVVLNIAEMRLYHYRKAKFRLKAELATYPVSIGQVDWRTPLGQHTIVGKRKNPSWVPPESIHREAEALGKSLPKIVPPGPNNPLGDYALSLDRPGYLIHGTNKPLGIGMRVTHGCVRMYPEDISDFYRQVSVGTKVNIVHQAIKIGWYADQLYLEVHPPLVEFFQSDAELLETAISMLFKITKNRPVNIRSSLIRKTITEKNGVPVRLTHDLVLH